MRHNQNLADFSMGAKKCPRQAVKQRVKFLGDDIFQEQKIARLMLFLPSGDTKSLENNFDVKYSRKERRGNSRLNAWPQVMTTALPPLFAPLLC